jgi:hypothetical protein
MDDLNGSAESTESSLRLCPLCEREVEAELYAYHYNTELHLIERILHQYYPWKENREKALWFYRRFILRK